MALRDLIEKAEEKIHEITNFIDAPNWQDSHGNLRDADREPEAFKVAVKRSLHEKQDGKK